MVLFLQVSTSKLCNALFRDWLEIVYVSQSSYHICDIGPGFSECSVFGVTGKWRFLHLSVQSCLCSSLAPSRKSNYGVCNEVENKESSIGCLYGGGDGPVTVIYVGVDRWMDGYRAVLSG